METNFNFKSQPATSHEQSERLLALGLKKETADMWYYKDSYGERISPFEEIWDEKAYLEYGTPAWSLHRLMILAEMKGSAFLDLDAAYETTISVIAAKIRFGYFNKEYLV